jgi:hypothetical protein
VLNAVYSTRTGSWQISWARLPAPGSGSGNRLPQDKTKQRVRAHNTPTTNELELCHMLYHYLSCSSIYLHEISLLIASSSSRHHAFHIHPFIPSVLYVPSPDFPSVSARRAAPGFRRQAASSLGV